MTHDEDGLTATTDDDEAQRREGSVVTSSYAFPSEEGRASARLEPEVTAFDTEGRTTTMGENHSPMRTGDGGKVGGRDLRLACSPSPSLASCRHSLHRLQHRTRFAPRVGWLKGDEVYWHGHGEAAVRWLGFGAVRVRGGARDRADGCGGVRGRSRCSCRVRGERRFVGMASRVLDVRAGGTSGQARRGGWGRRTVAAGWARWVS